VRRYSSKEWGETFGFGERHNASPFIKYPDTLAPIHPQYFMNRPS